MAAPGIAPQHIDQPDSAQRTKRDRPWHVILWNDPATPMSYVVYALRMLPGQILPVLTGDHELGALGTPIRERLFPPAYANDPLADLEFREMVGDGIVDARANAFR